MMKKLKHEISCSVLILFFLASLVVSSIFSQEKQHFAPEDLLNLRRLSDPQISPSGNWTAFVVTKFGEDKKTNSEIWLISKDGKVLEQMTDNPGPDLSPRWSPDERILAFLSRRNGERSPQIYFYSLPDKKTEKVTAEKGTIRDLKWSPDKNRIAFLMTDSFTEEEAKRREEGDDAFVVDQDEKHTRLWTLDVERRTTRLLLNQDLTVWNFNWSPDGKKIVVLASSTPNAEGQEYQSRLSLIDGASGEETILCQKTNAQASPSFSPDGKWIVYMGPVGQFKERGIIMVISAQGGKPHELLRNYEGNIWDVTWHPKKNTLLAGLAKGPVHHLISLDLKEKIHFHFQMEHSIIPYWGNFWSVSADGTHVAFLNEQPESPAEIWISDVDGKERKQLTRFNDYLRDVNLGQVEAVDWNNPKDGSRVQGIVVKPVNFSSDKRFPLVVWLHGGPAYNWSIGVHMTNWAQLFASQGYMVFLPNFRGSSGYGMKWMMANVENWGEGPMSDVMSGVDHLIDKGWVDEDRLLIGGASYGGYLTSWIITQTNRFKAAYVSAGVCDLVTEYALTDEPSFLLGYFNSSPYENPQVYRKNSPLTYASQVKTPVLIVHGERDLRVPVSQAYEFYSALKHLGAPAKLVIYPREYHGITEYTHQMDVMNKTVEWFRKHLKR